MSTIIALRLTDNYVPRHIQTSAAINKLSSCYGVIKKRAPLQQKLMYNSDKFDRAELIHSSNLENIFLLKGLH